MPQLLVCFKEKKQKPIVINTDKKWLLWWERGTQINMRTPMGVISPVMIYVTPALSAPYITVVGLRSLRSQINLYSVHNRWSYQFPYPHRIFLSFPPLHDLLLKQSNSHAIPLHKLLVKSGGQYIK